jgi:hypothetical protein
LHGRDRTFAFTHTGTKIRKSSLWMLLFFTAFLLGQVHSLFQSKISRQRDVVFSVSHSSISFYRKFVEYLPTSSSSSFFVFPLISCFKRNFIQKVWLVQLASFSFSVLTIPFSLLTLYSVSFFTRSAQLISLFLQHHISKYRINS